MMPVALFVLMLSIPVVIIAKKNIAVVALAALWGFFLAMTSAGPAIAHFLGRAGTAIAGLIS